jgi:hypothetical protein
MGRFFHFFIFYLQLFLIYLGLPDYIGEHPGKTIFLTDEYHAHTLALKISTRISEFMRGLNLNVSDHQDFSTTTEVITEKGIFFKNDDVYFNYLSFIKKKKLRTITWKDRGLVNPQIPEERKKIVIKKSTR